MRPLPPIPALAAILTSATLVLASTSPQAAPAAQRVGFDDLRRLHAEAASSARSGSATGIELTGYMLPSDLEGELVYEFMLVARPGACSHVDPPPASQVVRVIPERPFAADRMYQSVRVTGELLTEYNKAQLYVLDGVRIVESGFRISGASVEGVDDMPPAPPRSGKSPWRFLDN